MTLVCSRCGSPFEYFFFEIVPRHDIAFWYETTKREMRIDHVAMDMKKEREMKGKGSERSN